MQKASREFFGIRVLKPGEPGRVITKNYLPSLHGGMPISMMKFARNSLLRR